MPGSTGGRTPDRGICAISPSDLVGYVGNLINLVKDLEQRVAELEAGNVEANQLSDLSTQVGWVGGITYAGVGGWTQTEYGTLIPPPGVSFSSLGFTLSDGNTYPVVVMDEDGVLQFGFTNTGQVTGASAAAGGAVAVWYTSTIQASTVGTFSTNATGHTAMYDPSTLVSVVDSTQFKVNTSGIYQLTLTCSMNAFGTDKNALVDLLWAINSAPVTGDPNRTSGPQIKERIGDTGGGGSDSTVNTSSSRIMYVDSGSTMSLTAVGVGAATTFIVGAATLGFRLLKAVTLP